MQTDLGHKRRLLDHYQQARGNCGYDEIPTRYEEHAMTGLLAFVRFMASPAGG